MAGITYGERLLKLEEIVYSLNERSDTLQRGVQKLEDQRPLNDRSVAEIDKRLSLAEQRVSDLKESLDSLVARRWELGKLILVAFITSILTFALTLAANYINRHSTPNTNAAATQDATIQ